MREDEQAQDHFQDVVEELERRARRMQVTAVLVGTIGALLVVIAALYGWASTRQGASLLIESDYDARMLVFELVRIAAGAALLGAFAWGVLNLARAALDQSTRYEKRLIAGHFLVYVLRKFETQVKAGDIDLQDVMNVFSAWSDSVDSAFTHVKFGSKTNQALILRMAKDGVEVASGGASAPSGRA
ncbi:hypothetical protein [Aeromicrobium erythreum]|jgi:hypothetical protein|uniref:Uncharacterized protein n=1 Tax=Aeromicrobium erythreum TaxID=2041 RepID=A0A0U4BWT8_9ACTN|nr:hypothetical protein [Aeromicrobium erythreum]ALX03359.1 hypothetical protein AERYTH_00905 [Aeromicrobium erythreum]